MIDKVLELIRKEINTYIEDKLGGSTGEDRVLLTSFTDDSGGVAIPEDSVGLALLNIEEEKIMKRTGLMPLQKSEANSTLVNPCVNLNLQIMFAAHFNAYEESLKHISYILSFFQRKFYFDTTNTPDLAGIGPSKLLFELNSLGLEQQHYIWSMIGLRYLPSNIYKVRMLAIQEEEAAKEVPNIQTITTNIIKKEVND